MLTKQQYETKWGEIKGGVRNLWGQISDEELETAKGNLYEITGLIEERYNESKEDIRSKLQKLVDSFDNDTDKDIDPDVSSYRRSPVAPDSHAEDRIARH